MLLVALAVNLSIYVAAAYLIPQTDAERQRVDALFSRIDNERPASTAAPVADEAAGAHGVTSSS